MKAVQGFHISDALGERIAPLLPVHTPKAHPLSCYRRRVPDRQVRNSIFFVLRTGCQWKALDATGTCSGSMTYRRFQQGVEQGVFARRWNEALREYDTIGLDLDWLSLAGSRHKASLGGEKTEPNPTDRGQGGVKRSLLVEAQGVPIGVVLDGASRHDLKLTERTLASQSPAVADARQAWNEAEVGQHLCLDAGYDYVEVHQVVAAHGYTALSGHGAKKSRPKKRARKPAAGWLNAPISGSTGFATCSFAGPKSRKITWPCSTLPAQESPGTIVFLGEPNSLFG